MNEVRARVGVNLPPNHLLGKHGSRITGMNARWNWLTKVICFWDMRRWQLAHTEYTGYRVHGMKINGNTYEYVDCDYQDRRF